MRLLIVTVQYAYTLVVAASIQIWVTNICICTNMLQLVTESNRGIWIPSKINFHASNIIDRFTYHRAITQTWLKSFVRLLARINYFRSAVLSLLLAVTCATRNYDTSTEISHFFPPLPPPPPTVPPGNRIKAVGGGSNDRGKPMIEVERGLVRARKTINHAVTSMPMWMRTCMNYTRG